MKIQFDAMGRPMSEAPVTAEGLGARGGYAPNARRVVPKKMQR